MWGRQSRRAGADAPAGRHPLPWTRPPAAASRVLRQSVPPPQRWQHCGVQVIWDASRQARLRFAGQLNGATWTHQMCSMESCTAVSNILMRPSRKSSCFMKVSMVSRPFDRAVPRRRLQRCSSHSVPRSRMICAAEGGRTRSNAVKRRAGPSVPLEPLPWGRGRPRLPCPGHGLPGSVRGALDNGGRQLLEACDARARLHGAARRDPQVHKCGPARMCVCARAQAGGRLSPR